MTSPNDIMFASVCRNVVSIFHINDSLDYKWNAKIYRQERKEGNRMKFDELMKFHPQNKENFDEIKKAYSERALVPFVGAGLGIPPYKGWGEALKSICSVVPNALPELERLLSDNKYEQAASHVYNSLKIARFTRAFHKEFSPDKINEKGLSEAMKLLPTVFTGLVFTTNYDRCLEMSYFMEKRVFNAIYNIRDTQGYQSVIDQMLRGQPHILFKIHGDIDNSSGRVLLKEEYDDLYKENGPFVELLLKCFSYKCFLFIGCSMTGTDRYMQVLKQIAANHTIPHYAILPMLTRKDDETEETYQTREEEWESLLSDHWILPVFYPAGDYASVAEVLKSLNTTQQKTMGKSFVHHTGFYGRKTVVEEIQAQLRTDKYLLVYGEAGIGKTQVCEEIVSRFEGNTVTVYLQGARGYLSLLESMQNALGLAIWKSEKNEDQMKQAILEELRSLSSNKPFLIYLDNFEDVLLQENIYSHTGEKVEAVEDSDPSVALIVELVNVMPKQCHLLISSRDVLTGFPSKKVNPLDDSSMLMLFQRVFEQFGGYRVQLEQEEAALTELIRHLSGLPLAAVLAASQVTVSKSVGRILEIWNTIGNPSVRVAIDQNPTHKALRTALLVSYKHMGRNHDAKLLWGYLALVSQDLPDKLAELLLPNTLLQAEECLITLSLAERSQNGNGLSMLEPIKHQIFTYEPDIEVKCLTQLTKVYQSLIDECFGNQSKWHLAIEYLSDIIFFLNNLIDHKNELSYRLLNGLLNSGRYIINLIIYQPRTGLSFFEKIFSDEAFFVHLADDVKAVLYEGYADCQYYVSFHEKAKENYEKAQKLYESLGMKTRVANIMSSLGKLEYFNDNYTEAEQLYLGAKTIFEETDNTDGLATALMYLGELYCVLEKCESKQKEKEEKNEKAIQFLNQARLFAEQSKNALILANVYYSIGEYYSSQPENENEASLKYYNKALKLYEIEQDNLGQGNVYQAIGNIYFASNPKLAHEKYEQAISHFRKSEMPEKYFSKASRRIKECNRRINGLSLDDDFDVSEIIAKIDRKIAELEAEEALEHTNDYNGRLSVLINYCTTERTRDEMRTVLGLSSPSYFQQHYLKPLLQSGKIKMTIPDKPKSKYQKYITA